MLSQTGGHGDNFMAGPGLDPGPGQIAVAGRPPIVVDGVDGMRRGVRELLRGGADWIKLATTGGLVSDHDQPLIADFVPEELDVAVQEASRKGRPVAAHAYGGEGLTAAVEAGVRSIEHGGFLTEEQAVLMARRGCWLVPTLSAMRDCLRFAREGLFTPAAVPQGARARARARRLRAAREGARREARERHRLHLAACSTAATSRSSA